MSQTNIATVLSIQVGTPTLRTDPTGRAYTSAIGKTAVERTVFLGTENVAGDKQANRKYHGGPDKAVCVYSSEHYPSWRAEFEKPDEPFGSFGENLTTAGMTEDIVCIGDVYRFPSGAMIQVCQPRVPCVNVRRYWGAAKLPARMEETGFTGFYCRVLTTGDITPGDPLIRIEQPCPDWNLLRANRALYSKSSEAVDAERRALIALPPLSPECVRHVEKLLK